MVVSNKAAKQLGELFATRGYVRRFSKDLREKLGSDHYKKGSEVRLVLDSQAQLNQARRLLKSVGLEPGRPFSKHTRIVQPIYGQAAVAWFLKHLPKGANLGFRRDGSRTKRRTTD